MSQVSPMPVAELSAGLEGYEIKRVDVIVRLCRCTDRPSVAALAGMPAWAE